MPPREGGVGGGEDETQLDQEALSQMSAISTATPLPTATFTPTFTPEPSPPPVEIVKETAPSPARTRLARFPEWTTLRWVEITLALLGVSTGLLALFLHRTGRS